MQTVQLVIFYLYLMLYACLQTFDGMGRKVFGWELNTPLMNLDLGQTYSSLSLLGLVNVKFYDHVLRCCI
jgi:hypothetical protein